MKDNLEVAEALGLLAKADKESKLANVVHFGRSLFLAEARYDDATARSLFVKDGRARSQAEFERLGRQALGLLIQAGDPHEYRRVILQDENWQKMKKAGQPGFRRLFPGLDSGRIAMLAGDYTLISWWAKTMREAGETLEEMDRFLAGDANRDPNDEEFQRRRENLAQQLSSVAEKTKERFGEPWGLVAMHLASGGKARAEIRMSSDVLAFRAS